MSVYDPSDILPPNQPEFFGGTIALTQSSPNITFSTPLYQNPSLSDVTMGSYIYITSPSGKQVRLVFLSMQFISIEYIYVYDHPKSTYSQYRVATLYYGTSNTSVIIYSSRGGLTLYDQTSSPSNGQGFLAEASIAGDSSSQFLNVILKIVPGLMMSIVPVMCMIQEKSFLFFLFIFVYSVILICTTRENAMKILLHIIQCMMNK